ncbi:MAG TPA: hypothetical protein VGX91_05820 [Candidatus Cybelea sp.]|jgi:Cu/Zn superoxide dismutase|nr:hypothetical protein [Candidatus Cybelea sp.]
MKRIAALLASLAFVALYAAPAASATSTLNLKLVAQNGSGEDGQVTLTQTSDGLQVVIAIPNGPAGPQPAHVHMGSCAKLGGVAYPLTSVAGGASTTVIKGVTIDQLLGGKYAINVHKSADDLGTYVSCADIVMPSMGM